MNRFALLLLLIFSNLVQAQWFESSATAHAINGNWEDARERALKKAVKNALLFSGGSISSLQQVNNGVLVENKLMLNSKGEIKALTIVDENKSGDTLNITIKVDIQQQEAMCYGSNYPKSIAITRFKLNTPEQAVDGNIFNIHQQVTKTLYNQLKLSPQSLNIRQFIDYPVKLGEQYQDKNQIDTLRSLASSTDSQFLIYGEINDISVKFKSKNSISYWVKDPSRHFYLTVYLYDALQGHLISSKQYRSKALWEYGKHEDANLQSKAFWQKEYGQAIINLLDDVSTDLAMQLQCEQPTAKIVSVNSDTIQINLGQRNGLKKGNILSIFYASNHKDQFGIERNSKSLYEGTMKVIEVEKNSAILRTLDNTPLGNIQINDLARIK
jgi:hypothetical protein